jgi:hypothetical protein
MYLYFMPVRCVFCKNLIRRLCQLSLVSEFVLCWLERPIAYSINFQVIWFKFGRYPYWAKNWDILYHVCTGYIPCAMFTIIGASFWLGINPFVIKYFAVIWASECWVLWWMDWSCSRIYNTMFALCHELFFLISKMMSFCSSFGLSIWVVPFRLQLIISNC